MQQIQHICNHLKDSTDPNNATDSNHRLDPKDAKNGIWKDFWLLIADLYVAHSLLFVPTYCNWAGPFSSLCFPSHFPSPLPPSLSIKLPSGPSLPGHVAGSYTWVWHRMVLIGVIWTILPQNYFSPKVLEDMVSMIQSHAFLQNLNVIKSLKFTAGWH